MAAAQQELLVSLDEALTVEDYRDLWSALHGRGLTVREQERVLSEAESLLHERNGLLTTVIRLRAKNRGAA